MHICVSGLYDYQMFYHSTSILRDSVKAESVKDFIKTLWHWKLMNFQIMLVHLVLKYNDWILNCD